MDTVVALSRRDIARLSGPDAESFLQGQISQDVQTVNPRTSAWSLLLAPQGRVQGWFRLSRHDDGSFLLDIEAGFGEALITRLRRFCLRVDVEMETMSGWKMLSVRGASSHTLELDTVDAELRAEVLWPGFEGLDLLGPEVTVPHGCPVLDDEAIEVARIRAGFPAMGRELTQRTIPAEIAGLVETSVSFTKGCYTGQELVARIDSRGGNVPRPVRLLEIHGTEVPSAGEEILVGNDTVGEVTSAALERTSEFVVALGRVHRRVEPPAQAVVAGLPATILEVAA